MVKFLFLSTRIPLDNPNLEDFLKRQSAYFSNSWSLPEKVEVWFIGLNGLIKLTKNTETLDLTTHFVSRYKGALQIWSILKGVDLISSQSPWIDGILALILGKILNVKTVTQMHFAPELLDDKPIKKMVMSSVINRSNHVRLVSSSQLTFTKDLAKKSQIIPVPCVLPSNGTLTSNSNKKFDVIFFGRLHAEKGVSKLLEVLIALDKLFILRFLIVGDGPMKKEILRYLGNQDSRGSVEFIPWLSRENLFNLIRQSKLHLNLSPTESFGLSFIEAAACGTPSLASPTSGAKEIAKYIPSIQFLRSEDAPLIAQQIASLIQDDGLMSELHKLVPEFEFLERQFSDFTAWPMFLKSLLDTSKINDKGRFS